LPCVSGAGSHGGVNYLLPILALVAAVALGEPLALHPDNHHYFQFRGKPAVLVTSGEHYGAVLNLDFDYVKYLDTLAADGLNLTRTFSGSYAEPQGAFDIAENTLAPKPGRFICPWARSGEPGYGNGGNKFDLTKWDDAYFTRLKDFVSQAAQRGVIVELVLFCPLYEDSMWSVSPMNARNNINGIGEVGRTEVLTLKDARLTEVQVAMVRKIVSELRAFDNLYYEICNEPYFGGVTADWQQRVARTIAETEVDFAKKHLIAQNWANGSSVVDPANPLVDLYNFHYSRPPASVSLNAKLNRAIGNNETGFDGPADATYRVQGWDFLMAGGALYNNLDYSFTVGQEDGSFAAPASTPGGGSATLEEEAAPWCTRARRRWGPRASRTAGELVRRRGTRAPLGSSRAVAGPAPPLTVRRAALAPPGPAPPPSRRPAQRRGASVCC